MEIHSADRSLLSELASQLDLPHLVAFRDQLAVANNTVGTARVRQYQCDIATGGGLQIVSPVTGRSLTSGSTIVMPLRGGTFRTIFCFPGEPDVLAIADDPSLGLPIVGIVLLDKRLFLKAVDSAWSFGDADMPSLLQVIGQSGWSPGPARYPPTFIIGHENFAHYVWNQLPGVEQLIELAPQLAIVETRRPLGDIRQYLDVRDLSYATPERIIALNKAGSVTMMAGSLRITRSLATRMVSAFGKARSQKANGILARCGPGPVVWLNVRTRNRVALNQVEVLTALAGEFLRRSPQATVLIDGFSVAFDPAPLSDAVASADLAVAETVAAAVGHPNVHVAVGMNVGDSISLAGSADFYFSGHGTLQHKIGWFHPVPGIVHSNSTILNHQGIAPWVKDLSEVAVEPLYLPASHVVDAGLSEGADKDLQHLIPQGDYVIKNIDATIGLFVDETTRAGLL